jgi:hypothetical protein
MRIFYLLICVCAFVVHVGAQSPYVLRNSVEQSILDRMEILQYTDTFQMTSINNLDAKISSEWLLKAWHNPTLTSGDRYNLEHFFKQYIEFLPDPKTSDKRQTGFFENKYAESEDEKPMDKNYFVNSPVLRYLYRTPAHFLHIETPSFQLYVNPVLHFQYTKETGSDRVIFQNTRGAELKGYIDKKVYFFAQVTENQRSYPSFVEESIRTNQALPGQGFSKGFQSSVIKNLNGYDFFNARTYIGFRPVKSMQLELGHGNHFIGNGVRSLLLSDFSVPYFYLRLNTRVWKFHYQNLFKELTPVSTWVQRGGDNLLPKKYVVSHYLVFRPNQNFEVGLFETVIFSRPDHFEFQYLNPIILYRAVEHNLGSPDNVMLGLNLKWNFLKRFSLYGQVLADEFKFDEVVKQTGWWANKFGWQIGGKYLNVFGIDQLDIQAELNMVRPYTYGHRDSLPMFPEYSIANYSTFNQPLAHPLGANFREWIGIISYKPADRWYTRARILHTVTGKDKDGLNFGQNILKPNNTPPAEYNNFIGQGMKNTIFHAQVDVSYEFYHNAFIDLSYTYRQTRADKTTSLSLFSTGIRLNMQNIPVDY